MTTSTLVKIVNTETRQLHLLIVLLPVARDDLVFAVTLSEEANVRVRRGICFGFQ